jgi:hypothetical protein
MSSIIGAGSAIGEAFDSYRSEVIPTDASPTQIRECRLAFYAGSVATLDELMRTECGPPGDTISEEEQLAGARRVERLRLELKAFAEDQIAAGG